MTKLISSHYVDLEHQEYQKLVQACKQVDLVTDWPNTVTKDILTTRLVHVLARLALLQEQESALEEA